MPDTETVLYIDDIVSREGFIVIKPKTATLTDNSVIHKFGDELIEYLGENSKLPYCVNLGEITEFNSYALYRFIRFQSRHEAQIGAVPSLIITKPIYQYLQVTGMHQHFDLYTTPINFVVGRKMM